jgi:glutamate dehydrogenase
VSDEVVTPNELIHIALAAPVDLLWNGGIGTYVKASTESHDQAGDRTNDAVRVDGNELRCKVAVEGGNLGFTQAARIEYASGGGRINTDFIDNSGGVDCSDREVNLKILCSLAIERGELDRDSRDDLISQVADQVVERILYDNYQQAQILSQEVAAASRRMDAYEELMRSLEADGMLDRVIDGLPSSDEMSERARAGRPLTRPELAVLLADAKRSVKDSIVDSALPEDPYLLNDVRQYFPANVTERFDHLLAAHPLRRQLIATLLANDVVNSEGVVFVSRVCGQTGADPSEVVAAYRVARDVSRAVQRWEAIEATFGQVSMERWNRLMQASDRAVAALTRWFLSLVDGESLGELIADFAPGFEEIESEAFEVGPPEWRRGRADAVARLVAEGVPEDLARRHAALPVVVYGGDVIQVATDTDKGVRETLEIFLCIGRALGLDQLTDIARTLEPADRWHRWALWTAEEELLAVRRRAAERVIEFSEGRRGEEAVEHFLETREGHVSRLIRFMQTFELTGETDVAPLMVALRQVRAALS